MRYNCIISLYLLSILVLSLISGPKIIEVEGADGSFGGGSGTVSDPFIIEDIWDLQNMNKNHSAHYVLKNDIDASSTSSWHSGAGFEPIGTYSDSFVGSLDGRNFTINGLFIYRSTSNNVGLFGCVSNAWPSQSMVKNLGLVDIDVTGANFVGGICGSFLYGTISNCYVTGSVTGNDRVGGLAGHKLASIYNSYSTARINAKSNAGGLVGWNQNPIFNSYSTGSVDAEFNCGGLVGYCMSPVINSHYNIKEVMIKGGHYLTTGGLFDDQYQDWMSNGLSLDISDYSSTIVNSGGYYLISDGDGIRDLLGFADVLGYRFRLSKDIDLSSYPDLYIPYFGGSEFDGDNHTISNVNVDLDFVATIGMIGYARDYTIIRNLNVADIDITGRSQVGGLIADISNSKVENCHMTGKVTGTSSVGGLIGEFNSATIINCTAIANVTGTGDFSIYLGGLIGSGYYGSISNCHTVVNVTGNGAHLGGLVGGMTGSTLSNCSALGSVRGESDYVGGLVGNSEGGTITCCYAGLSVNGIGRCIGGLVGLNKGPLSNSYSIGNVTGTDDATGGLVGQNSNRITNCYSTGNVSGSGPLIGGHIGKNFVSVSGCFWDVETSGRSSSDGGTGKTTDEMKTKGTFTDAGWDFDGTWNILGGVTYPFLRWQDARYPIADAGEDQITYLGADGKVIVVFDGTGSEDDLAILNYTWSFIHNGSEVLLFGQEVEYIFSVHGTYDVTLKVTDISGNWGTDSTIIAVFDITPPIANAGSDQTVDEGTMVTFDGSSSSDNAGIVDYEWTFTDDGPVSLNGVGPNYRFNHPGVFLVTLKVTDAAENSNLDTLIVTINDITPPIADAGPDQTVDEGTMVTFGGNGSSDNVGIVNWTWSFTDDQPIMVYGENPTHLFDDPGTFLVELNVTDSVGHWDLDDMTLRVIDITTPIAEAGPDQTVDEGTIVTFNGNGSSDNVGILNWTWSFTDGLGVMVYGVKATYLFDDPGTFVVTLNVSDAAGNWRIDTMTVAVLDTTDPLANAGENRTVPAGTLVTFNGSLSTDNDIIKEYSWSSSYDGEVRTLKGLVVSFQFDKGGSYEIALTVTDRSNNTDVDTVTITVIDTGKVTGIVLDEDGNPVPGSTVEITASNGIKYTTTTGLDGSFSVDVFYGSFSWKITKSGYKTVSGTGTVGPMGEMEIDLSETALVKEEKGQDGFSSSICIYLIMASVIIFLLGFIIFLLMRRKEPLDIDRWEEE